MTRRSRIVGFVVLIAFAVAVGYGGWRMIQARHAHICDLCGREMHARSQVIASVGGEHRTFCCAACALTTQQQSGQPLEWLEVTDYHTDRPIDPEEAFLVVGSGVNLCMQQHALLHGDKETAPLEFDRCTPSILAFDRRADAVAFTVEHSGRVLTLEDLTEAASR